MSSDARFRHLLFGKKPHMYRVIFRIVLRTKTVHVIHIRHGAMDAFTLLGKRPGR